VGSFSQGPDSTVPVWKSQRGRNSLRRYAGLTRRKSMFTNSRTSCFAARWMCVSTLFSRTIQERKLEFQTGNSRFLHRTHSCHCNERFVHPSHQPAGSGCRSVDLGCRSVDLGCRSVGLGRSFGQDSSRTLRVCRRSGRRELTALRTDPFAAAPRSLLGNCFPGRDPPAPLPRCPAAPLPRCPAAPLPRCPPSLDLSTSAD
jgi:hypothetical protein